MDQQKKVSLNEIIERYKAEDFELATDVMLKVNLAVTPIHLNKKGKRGKHDELLVSLLVDGECVAYGFVRASDEEKWTIQRVAQIFNVPFDAAVWEVGEHLSWDEGARLANELT
jgi:hypothetical protein